MANLPEVQIIRQQSSREKNIVWGNGNITETFLFSWCLSKEEFSSVPFIRQALQRKKIRKGSFKRDGQAIKWGSIELQQCFCRLFWLRKNPITVRTWKFLGLLLEILCIGKSYGKPELFTSHSQMMGQDRKLMFQLWLGSTLLCFIVIALVWEWNYWWSGAWFPCQHKTSTNKDLVAKIHTSQHTILSFTSDKTYSIFWLATK